MPEDASQFWKGPYSHLEGGGSGGGVPRLGAPRLGKPAAGGKFFGFGVRAVRFYNIKILILSSQIVGNSQNNDAR